MPLGQIGAVLLFLVIVFVLGNLWFYFIEAILHVLKRLLVRGKKPSAWHPLPPEKEAEKNS